MESFIYGVLSFRVYDFDCPCLDTEWLLSTLFDASLLSTFKSRRKRRLFFARSVNLCGPVLPRTASRWKPYLLIVIASGWTPGRGRAIICSS
jgi:hypothetical protein